MSESDPNEVRWDAVGEALELLREGDTEQALKELQRILVEDADNEYGHYYLGVAYFERGEFVPAMKAYLRAIELAPAYLGAMLGLGHALRMLGRYQESIRVGREVLIQQPEDPDALHLLGLAHFAQGDEAEARDYLQRFLNTRPEVEVQMEVEGMLEVLGGNVVALHPDITRLN
ncbi:MAG: tetratricopeptide repeat protein [Myxococcales bacterium]|nr:tetratricopeptide repeat protein [Myxococcales bacterium]MCB9709405.1 tetratricopeptide repeat protein [Myxococcales bacterium]